MHTVTIMTFDPKEKRWQKTISLRYHRYYMTLYTNNTEDEFYKMMFLLDTNERY